MYVSFRCGCAHIVWCGRITHLGFRDTISRGSLTGGATRGPKGAQFPARGVTMERRKISTMSQYFLQYSTFASERPQFEHGDVKLASCSGHHLTSLRHCHWLQLFYARTLPSFSTLNQHVPLSFSSNGQLNILQVSACTGQNPRTTKKESKTN